MIERGRDNLGFEPRLLGVSDLLPIASAAARQVWARRRAPRGPRLEHTFGARDQVAPPFLHDRYLEQIAGRRVRHHHGLAVEPPDAIRPECHRGYLDLCHRYGERTRSSFIELGSNLQVLMDLIGLIDLIELISASPMKTNITARL